MLVRPACRQAARLKSSSDHVWVSENLLRDAYQRFASISHTSKRHGSFVPGPLESRRRLGKRRMAYALEQHIPSPAPNLSFLWSWLSKEVDTTQWTWEAPRGLTEEQAPHKSIPSPAESSTALPSMRASKIVEWSLRNTLAAISETADTGNERELWDVCQRFIITFKAHIALGSMPDGDTRSGLECVAEVMGRDEFRCKESSQMCLLLYRAAWEGILACKVIPMESHTDALLKAFIWGLFKQPPSREQQSLLSTIIRSVTASQLEVLQSEICLVVDMWRESWTEELGWTSEGPLFQSLFEAAENEVRKATSCVSRVANLRNLSLEAISKNQFENFDNARDAFQYARMAIESSLESINTLENIVVPGRASVLALANMLMVLPKQLVASVLRSCTSTFCGSIEPRTRHFEKHLWLSLLGELPNVDDELFLELWKQLDTTYLGVEPLFRHWSSQGRLKHPLLVRNTLEITSNGNLDFASLLYATAKHGDDHRALAKNLFNAFEVFGRYTTVVQIMQRMCRLRMKLPEIFFRNAIETMSQYSMPKTFQLYFLQQQMTHEWKPLHLWGCPNFFTAQIEDPDRHSTYQMWNMLDLPTNPLPPGAAATLGNLLVKIICAFAYSEHRPRSVALRNVVRCISYLQRNGHSISPVVSRALTHAGITRSMLAGNFIRDGKLRWILDIIEEAEGADVALSVEKVVRQWNAQIVYQQEMARRGRYRANRACNILSGRGREM